MAGKVQTTRQDTHLLVHVKGDPLSPEEVKTTLRTVLTQAAESNLNIVFLQESPGKLSASTLDFFSWANVIGASEFRNKIAVVFPKQMRPNNLEILEDAARNHGISVRLFFFMEEAVEWIAGGEDDS